jgi:hypothetical protein
MEKRTEKKPTITLESVVKNLHEQEMSVKFIAMVTAREETLIRWYIKEIEEG